MRAATSFLGGVLLLALAIPVAAQQSTGAVFMQNWAGSNARTITNVPIDTSSAMKTMNINSAFRTPNQQKTFNMGNIFPKVQMPSWPPKVASTPILGQKNNPYQPNPIIGINPFGQAPTK